MSRCGWPSFVERSRIGSSFPLLSAQKWVSRLSLNFSASFPIFTSRQETLIMSGCDMPSLINNVIFTNLFYATMTYLFVAILMMSPRSLCRSRWSDQEHKLLIWDSVIRHHPHIIMIIEMQRYVGTMVMNNISWSWLALQGDYHSMHTPDRLKDSLRWLIMIMMMIPEDWSDWRKRPCRWLEACCCEDAARPTCSDWKASRRAALLIKTMT